MYYFPLKIWEYAIIKRKKNVVIASFVTAQARLKLYDELRK